MAFIGDVETERYKLTRSGNLWTGAGRAASVRVNVQPVPNTSAVLLQSPTVPVQRIQLRWKCRLPGDALALGDAWERSYGELEWRHLQAERVMPWYAMLHANARTAGMGVKTGAVAFAFWQVDTAGISLWLDVRNGGSGVALGDRRLEMAMIVTCQGTPGESAFAVTQRLCRAMAEGTKIPGRRGETSLDVIYGSNDWYYAYGKNTHDGIVRDADLVKWLSPANASKPFTVIDDGYQDRSRFPSLPKLAAEIRSRGVIPGIWIRPLQAPASAASNLLLPAARCPVGEHAPPAYDTTIPEGLEAAAAVATEACDWGFDLIKHDFTTFELPVGEPDGGFSNAGQLAFQQSVTDQRGDCCRALPAAARRLRRRARDSWMQYGWPSLRRHLRCFADWGRCERKRVGADAPHGRQYTGISLATAQDFLLGRCGLCPSDSRDSVVDDQAVAECCG
jgi:alpha-galactosidase